MEPHMTATHQSSSHQTYLRSMLRTKILIQYSILSENRDYMYNPTSLIDYLSYDPGMWGFTS